MLAKYPSLFISVVAVVVLSGCGTTGAGNNAAQNTAAAPQAQATPGKNFTKEDIAKLKWIEGSWKGMEGDKPFYETYHFENDTTLVVESSDGKDTTTTRYELKDGEFGNTDEKIRSAASEITADHVQFVPVTPGSNSFRFQRNDDGTWTATLIWPGTKGRRPGSKVYKMEPWKKQ
jgi:hypothetical protein